MNILSPLLGQNHRRKLYPRFHFYGSRRVRKTDRVRQPIEPAVRTKDNNVHLLYIKGTGRKTSDCIYTHITAGPVFV